MKFNEIADVLGVIKVFKDVNNNFCLISVNRYVYYVCCPFEYPQHTLCEKHILFWNTPSYLLSGVSNVVSTQARRHYSSAPEPLFWQRWQKGM